MTGNRDATTNFQHYLKLIDKCATAGQAAMVSGSAVELPLLYTAQNFTDFDALFFDEHTLAIEHNMTIRTRFRNSCKNIVLEIDTRGIHTGFAKLRRNDGKLFEHYQGDPLCPAKGPSRKYEISNIVLRFIESFFNVTNDVTIDHVQAVFCPVWPSVADEWTQRARQHGWPTNELIKDIVSAGCHLVGKPHLKNVENKHEWRFSFSKAELLLLTSWNPNQLYIYHILRLVKHRLIQACGGSDKTSMSTYHFKTLMLWACEHKSVTFWDEENTVASIKELLVDMVVWLNEKRCPHYFIPSNNILDVIPNDEELHTETQFLVEIETNEALIHLVHKIPRACSECELDITCPNSTLLYTLFRFYHYNNNYFPRDQDISANIQRMKKKRLKQEMVHVFTAIQNQALFLKSSSPLSRRIALLQKIDDSFETIIKTRDSGLTRIRLSSKNGIMFLRSVGIESNHHSIDDGRQGRYAASVVCSNRSTDPHLQHFKLPTATTLMKALYKTAEEMHLGPSLIHGLAFAANYYYATRRDYQRAVRLCETGLNSPYVRRTSQAFPFTFASDFAILFDTSMQTVLGFLLLFTRELKPSNRHLKVCVRVSVLIFFRYILLQCFRMSQSWDDVSSTSTDLRYGQLCCGFHEDSQLLDYLVMNACLRASGIHV